MCNHKKKFYKDFGVRYCHTCMQAYKPRKYTIHVFVLVLLIGLLSFKPIKHQIVHLHKPIKDTTDVQLVDSCLLKELTNSKVLFPEYAIQSSKLETGNFTSEFCLKYRNLFGISFCKSEYQIGYYNDGMGHNVAIYKSYKECILDYKRLQSYYAYQIDRKYSETANYTAKLTKL